MLREAAADRAAGESAILRKQVRRRLRARWTAMLSIAVQGALAATLVQEGESLLDAADGIAPAVVDLWLDAGR